MQVPVGHKAAICVAQQVYTARYRVASLCVHGPLWHRRALHKWSVDQFIFIMGCFITQPRGNRRIITRLGAIKLIIPHQIGQPLFKMWPCWQETATKFKFDCEPGRWNNSLNASCVGVWLISLALLSRWNHQKDHSGEKKQHSYLQPL